MLNLNSKDVGALLSLIAVATISFLIVFFIGTALARSDNSPPPETSPAAPNEEGEGDFRPGPEWDGQGTQGISQRDAEEFDDYPIFWLGERFAGYNLQGIVRQKYDPPDGIPEYEAMDSVTFGYGECLIPDEGRACPVPIVVATEPACLKRPENIADAMKAGSLEKIGDGAELLRFRDGHLRLWTGEVSIYVDAPADQSLTERMVQEMQGMNAKTSAGDELPAPDFTDCPEMELPTPEIP